jgi:hypothetical protein
MAAVEGGNNNVNGPEEPTGEGANHVVAVAEEGW